MTYVLFYAGALSHGDSVSIASADFSSQQTCEEAGKTATDSFKTMMKDSKYVCVRK